MALVAQSFAERYAELVSREPTIMDLLLDVQRCEVGERKKLEEASDIAFKDVLHLAAVMIADKKYREKGNLAHLNRFEVTLYKKQTAVWFPAKPPQQVALPQNRAFRAFPYAAFHELCVEERELRQWHYGVERRLREHIEEACGRAWFFTNCFNDLKSSENLPRQRLERDEGESFTALKRSFFRTAPADYYRHAVIARFGETVRHDGKDKDPIQEEAERRVKLYQEEEDGRVQVFEYLQDVYRAQMFVLNHSEVVARYQLEEEERNTLYPSMAQCCRDDFGIVFYHTPALGLHLSASQPCLRALCLIQLKEGPIRTERTRSRFSWVCPDQGLCDTDQEEREDEESLEIGLEEPPTKDRAPSATVKVELVGEQEMTGALSPKAAELLNESEMAPEFSPVSADVAQVADVPAPVEEKAVKVDLPEPTPSSVCLD